jgi:hypothetical protein
MYLTIIHFPKKIPSLLFLPVFLYFLFPISALFSISFIFKIMLLFFIAPGGMHLYVANLSYWLRFFPGLILIDYLNRKQSLCRKTPCAPNVLLGGDLPA